MALAPAIQAQQLGKHYRGGVRALADVDLEVPAGTVYGLLGQNGVARVRVGQPVDLAFTALGLNVTAPVGFIAPIPTANPVARPGQSRKYEVRVPIAEADSRILVGQPVDAKIHVDARR